MSCRVARVPPPHFHVCSGGCGVPVACELVCPFAPDEVLLLCDRCARRQAATAKRQVKAFTDGSGVEIKGRLAE